MVDKVDIPGTGIQNVDWIEDGEVADETVLNRPTKDVSVVVNEIIDEVNVIMDTIFPVGSVTMRMDGINPGTLYSGQTWTLITGDAALTFGDGTDQTGTTSGSNTQSVPLLSHRHGMNHTHSRGSMNITGYFGGDDRLAQNPKGGAFYNGTNLGGEGADGGGGTATVYFNAANTWSGSTSNPSTSVTDYTGSGAPTMDVRGARLAVNVWQRTA